MQQWKFNPAEGDNAVSNGDEVVFYIDDLNGEVIAKIVEVQNTDPTGDFLTKIDEYLQGEDKCSPDEREFVLEQIGTYLQLSKASSEEVNNANPQQPEKQGPAEGANPSQGTGGTKDTASGPAANNTTATPQSPNPNPNPEPTPQKNTRRTTQTARTTTTTTRTSTSKVESTEDLIKALQEKIELIKLLDKAEVIEIPTGLGKTAREILTDFQRDQQAMIATYMDRVKTM